ncbi:phage Gp37/Gp68 family protein [Rhodobium gokarnense]|uniref:Protein gp37 n=1 Tax=Rhodobium gokarnense TaxID=364296 RepID=A0ABT3H8A0_9HYPH|nr:phage Gp37/Gp68 family protein [Rhodobium gokarnense]MCW2306625.1 protein gp37 [Rhodobium gokarnense]
MTVLDTQISCFDTTWNPSTGCTKVSAGCDNCYAEAIAKRFFGGFDLRLYPKRLSETRKFRPLVGADGAPIPRRVFVNSMSDLWHPGVPDDFLASVFDAIAGHPTTIFVCLTKRASRLRAFGERRWKTGVPDNLWLGVTAETAAVANRIDQLRRLKDAVGPFTAYVNVEPLLEPVPGHDFSGIDWVGVGGEAGARARPCAEGWVRDVVDRAHGTGAAVWFKSWGRWENNPAWPLARGKTKKAKKQDLVDRGLELLPEEHGGATLDGRLVQELPPAFALMRERLVAARG